MSSEKLPPPYQPQQGGQYGSTAEGIGHKQEQPYEARSLPPNSSPGQPGYLPPQQGGYYAPAPPIFPQQQQQSHANVVVVGPSAGQHPVVIESRGHYANSHVALTAVLMILCFLHGNLLAFVCLIPALICACSASDHNVAGDYETARSCGTAALVCDILAIAYFVLLVIAAVVVVVIYFTIIIKAADDIPTMLVTVVDT